MPVWSTTRLSISEVNTLVTIVSLVVRFCMSVMLAAVALEIRRLMIVRGEKDAIIQDADYRSVWTALKTSKARSWTVLAVLPVLLGYTARTLTEFTTSGISASIVHSEGEEVSVLGLVGQGINDYLPVFPSIASIIDDSENVAVAGVKGGHLALLSPEISTVGLSSNASGYKVQPQYYVGSNDGPGVFVPGEAYTPPLSILVSFCLEVTAENDVLTVDECRDNLMVEMTERQFDVASLQSGSGFLSHECDGNAETIALGNQGVDFVERDLTFSTGASVMVTCSSIFESVIESCVWKDNGVLYFGDWNIFGAGSCISMDLSSLPTMIIVGIEYEPEVEQGSDAAKILAAMTAEIFAGTGTLVSRQQLMEILGAIVRLEGVVWGVQTAFVAEEVVEIGISLWIPLVLFLSLFLPGVGWVFFRFQSGKKEFFLPVRPAEWSACAARELHGDKSCWWTVDPLGDYYDHVYAFGQVSADERGVASQRLGWVRKQDVLPVVASADRFGSAWAVSCVDRSERMPPPLSGSDPRMFNKGGASSAAISADGRR